MLVNLPNYQLDIPETNVPFKRLIGKIRNSAEIAIIARLLVHYHWHRGKVAQALGISYRALLYKLKAAGLKPPEDNMHLAWGSKVSQQFRNRVTIIAQELAVDPSWLMAIIAFESRETFSASVRNAAGSGAVGLIQFMPQTARLLGTTVEALAAMTAEEQLGPAARYFWPDRGQIHSLSDMYMLVLWPAAFGKPDDYVLFDKSDPQHPARYIENRGLDWNGDGKITKQEAAARVSKMLYFGLQPPNVFDDTNPDQGTLPGINPVAGSESASG